MKQSTTTSDYYTHVEKYDWVTDPKYPEKLLHTLRAKHIVSLVKKYATHTTVLDLGCGTGLITKDLPGKVFGVDLNPWNIERARTHCPNATLAVGNAEQPLPFSPNTFDVVVCTDMLEHIDHPNQVIHNAAQVLVPGGYFIGEVPSKCPIWKLRKVLSRTCPADEPFHRNYNIKEVRELLKDFQVISVQYSAMFMEVSFVARKA